LDAGRGEELFATSCAGCHGRNARGAEAPNLYKSRTVLYGSTQGLFDLLKEGIDGTEMRPLRLPNDQIREIARYLQTLVRPNVGVPVKGDPESGRKVFDTAGCSRCHQIAGKGGVLGPDLSSVALRRSGEQIRQDILDPNKELAEGYRTVSVTTRKGDKIVGALKNEDNFSLQIMKSDGEYALLLRSDATEVRIEDESLMPGGVARKLSSDDLQNLLAFLDRQRAPFLKIQVGFNDY
jgi:cytochrome c oxidase cbb3-type subunit 3